MCVRTRGGQVVDVCVWLWVIKRSFVLLSWATLAHVHYLYPGSSFPITTFYSYEHIMEGDVKGFIHETGMMLKLRHPSVPQPLTHAHVLARA